MTELATKNGLTWIALLALTLLGFFNAEAGVAWLAYVVLLIASLKFVLIFLVFMEMSQAHRAWKTAMLLFLLLLVGAISFSL